MGARVSLLLCTILFGAPVQAESPFGRTLQVNSTADGGRHEGEIRAIIDQPHSIVAPALARPAHWCEILTLQVNVKRCTASADGITALITRKPRDRVDDAHRIDFSFRVAAASADKLQVVLSAPDGPVGTRDYEIHLQATPQDAKRTLIRMTYAYTLGFMARLGMDIYLAGAGRDKIGFSVVDKRADGRPVYVDGVRGVVERSAMRYYLAIDASLPPGQSVEARSRRWYSEIARYPQLKEEVGADEYVEMKRREAVSDRLPAG